MNDGGILPHRKFRSLGRRSPAAGKSSSLPPDTGGNTRQTLKTCNSLFGKAEIYRYALSGTLEKDQVDPVISLFGQNKSSSHAHSPYRGLFCVYIITNPTQFLYKDCRRCSGLSWEITFTAMAPKLAKKRKAAAASRIAVPAKKKKKTSSSLPTDIETAPSSSDSPPPVSRAGVSYGAGPRADIESEGISVASGEE